MILARRALPQEPWQFLLLEHRAGHWSFPKGHVEPGEDDWQAATRELAEETGVRELTPLEGVRLEHRYRFERDGRPVDKTVIYFLATTSRARIVLSEEHPQGGWFPFPQAQERLTYEADRRLLRQAHARLRRAFPA